MVSEQYAIGIDLGTTYSCVGVWRNERVEILANDQGNRTTPSYVAFTSEERLVGDAALNQAARNAANTIFGTKRMIGRHCDAQLEADKKHWPFRVANVEGRPVVQVEHLGQLRSLAPEEISAMVLAKMKQTAELKLGHVSEAVITVPAYFNEEQRQATKDAGEMAGLKVLRILCEPTAAAVAYGIDAKSTAAKNILVYDLGGGTFDASLLRIDGAKFVVFATAGDTHLGGEDFDSALVDHFVAVFREQHRHDLTSSPKAMRRLRTNCERAKRALSSTTRVQVEVDSIYEGIDFSCSLTRAKFESLCYPLFASTVRCIDALLRDAGMARGDIDEVVLSGGSSRIPKVQQLLSDFFGGKPVNASIHLDEAVATGAAVQAALLTGTLASDAIVLTDVTPLSLGIEIEGGRMDTVVPRSTPIPASITKVFTTSEPNQQTITFSVFEGESIDTRNNLALGQFSIAVPRARREVPRVDVTFHVDGDGILTVTAKDSRTHVANSIVIQGHRGRLTKDLITCMIDDALELDARDEQMRINYQSLNAPEPASALEKVKFFLGGLFTRTDEPKLA